MRTIFELSAENAKVADWVADGAVSVEPVSALKLPDQQGRYRDFIKFGTSLVLVVDRKSFLRAAFSESVLGIP